MPIISGWDLPIGILFHIIYVYTPTAKGCRSIDFAGVLVCLIMTQKLQIAPKNGAFRSYNADWIGGDIYNIKTTTSTEKRYKM